MFKRNNGLIIKYNAGPEINLIKRSNLYKLVCCGDNHSLNTINLQISGLITIYYM